MDRLSDYDYDLPPELIAQRPLAERDQARLMVVRRDATLDGTAASHPSGDAALDGTAASHPSGDAAGVEHRGILDLPELLQPGDCLVFNDTRVVKARLFGFRESTGGKWEGLFLSTDDAGLDGAPATHPSRVAGRWRLIGRTRGRLKAGERIVLSPARVAGAPGSPGLALTLVERDAEGVWLADPAGGVSAWDALEQFGSVPLPPYIHRKEEEPDDAVRYQTVFARHAGAVAAPTAGLHFTPRLLERLAVRGIETAFVTLHVGTGTFRPIAVENLSEHRMHSEWCRLTAETAERLNRVRSRGGRIVAVGTTSVRTLESSYVDGFQAVQRETRLFIRPPYRFRAVDALLTNFHLPKSSLLVLVAAFLGLDRTKSAYAEGIRERYRFFSYGDAMLIL
jgi:S-adenosylmethionine:tRNA ribosyltransferase-isomerase